MSITPEETIKILTAKAECWRTYAYVNGRPKFLPKCGFNQIYVNGEDFCSRAERRENDKR